MLGNDIHGEGSMKNWLLSQKRTSRSQRTRMPFTACSWLTSSDSLTTKGQKQKFYFWAMLPFLHLLLPSTAYFCYFDTNLLLPYSCLLIMLSTYLFLMLAGDFVLQSSYSVPLCSLSLHAWITRHFTNFLDLSFKLPQTESAEGR